MISLHVNTKIILHNCLHNMEGFTLTASWSSSSPCSGLGLAEACVGAHPSIARVTGVGSNASKYCNISINRIW